MRKEKRAKGKDNSKRQEWSSKITKVSYRKRGIIDPN